MSSSQYLIKGRVDVDAGDTYRVTPLHLAAIGKLRKLDCCCFNSLQWTGRFLEDLSPCNLVHNRSQLISKDLNDLTLCFQNLIENHINVCRALLEARALVDPADVEGDLPIHWAATKGHTEVWIDVESGHT